MCIKRNLNYEYEKTLKFFMSIAMVYLLKVALLTLLLQAEWQNILKINDACD